jgi:hypothetical protein
MVGQAGVGRRRGDMARARELLDEAARQYDASSLAAGRAGVLAGLAWWHLAAGDPAQAVDASSQAGAVATETHDPTDHAGWSPAPVRRPGLGPSDAREGPGARRPAPG